MEHQQQILMACAHQTDSQLPSALGEPSPNIEFRSLSPIRYPVPESASAEMRVLSLERKRPQPRSLSREKGPHPSSSNRNKSATTQRFDSSSQMSSSMPSTSRQDDNEIIPSKRVRADHTSAVAGLQPHPAMPPELDTTPLGYTNEFSHLHPWGSLVRPRPSYQNISEDTVTSQLPTHVYWHIPSSGYLGARFVRSLFPRRFRGVPSRSNKLPIMELMRLPDIISFRQHAIEILDQLLEGRYVDDTEDIRRLGRTSDGPPACVTAPPPTRQGTRPVLYQVVARNYGQGVLLEAKDFFIPGPDHNELLCIPLVQDSVNLLTQTRGFDRTYIAVKDFIWVYSLRPTPAALQSTDRLRLLRCARMLRSTLMDTGNPYFFRVHEYIPVLPAAAPRTVLGMVLSIRHTASTGEAYSICTALEGCREPVNIPASVAHFPLDSVEREDMVLAEVRPNVSTAIRFSHPPISRQAQWILVNAVRRFLPVHPSETVMPLDVYRMTDEDLRWIADRQTTFSNYARHPRTTRRRMGKLFSVACAALAATSTASDDAATYQLEATVPSMDSFPVRLQFQLPGRASEGGWSHLRPAQVWIVDSKILVRMKIGHSRFSFQQRQLHVELHSVISSHRMLQDAIQRYSREEIDRRTIQICVTLDRLPSGTDPLFELLANERLFANLSSTPCMANNVLEWVYGNQASALPNDINQLPATKASNVPTTVQLGNSQMCLTPDQVQAVRMGLQDYPILAIQAAFGTGKTVVAALIAAHAALSKLVVVTATTNVACAQFIDTLRRTTPGNRAVALRFVADSALKDNAPTTSADLHAILRTLVEKYGDKLSAREKYRCQRYINGRQRIETILFDPNATLHLSDEEREEYRIAERKNSEATEEAIKIMMRVRPPTIICMTVASLLKSTTPGGLFHDSFIRPGLIIGDEASQIPEPAFVALVARFTSARHVYVGDARQLEPHIRCPRTSRQAQLGARGIMDILLEKNIPVAPLVTTFRAHPSLNRLPNELFYEGTLISGTPSIERSLLCRATKLPNPATPLVTVDVHGNSQASRSGSHTNENEARCCRDIICGLLDAGLPPTSLAIITFYKEQQRLLSDFAARLSIALHTVDSRQGREMDVVVVLTSRSDMNDQSGQFLDDPKRMNVAITRCRHGQFLLGNVSALRTLTNWGRLVRWAEASRLVVSTASLPDIFT